MEFHPVLSWLPVDHSFSLCPVCPWFSLPDSALLILDLLSQPPQSYKQIPCHKFQYMVLLTLLPWTLTDTLAIKYIVYLKTIVEGKVFSLRQTGASRFWQFVTRVCWIFLVKKISFYSSIQFILKPSQFPHRWEKVSNFLLSGPTTYNLG